MTGGGKKKRTKAGVAVPDTIGIEPAQSYWEPAYQVNPGVVRKVDGAQS